MPLFIASLNSGSNGNCYYIGNDTEAVLIDAGLSCRETEKRMKNAGLCMSRVKAIFVSHEHADHISGIAVLSKKYQLPVYITPATHKNSRLFVEKHLIFSFSANEPVFIGGLSISGFAKSHDASDPHSFVVAGDQVTVGVFTDIGIVCEQVIHYFKQCTAAILEANYDEEMLAGGSYPYYLKKRISADKGHLSNSAALQLFKEHKPAGMSYLILGHLSKNNNCPKLVERLFNESCGTTKIIVASRYEASPVYEINITKRPVFTTEKALPRPEPYQLSMF